LHSWSDKELEDDMTLLIVRAIGSQGEMIEPAIIESVTTGPKRDDENLRP